MAVPKLVKNGHNSPFGSAACLVFPYSIHALTRNLKAKSGLLTIFNHFRNKHERNFLTK
jgi:hypothetical protein